MGGERMEVVYYLVTLRTRPRFEPILKGKQCNGRKPKPYELQFFDSSHNCLPLTLSALNFIDNYLTTPKEDPFRLRWPLSRTINFFQLPYGWARAQAVRPFPVKVCERCDCARRPVKGLAGLNLRS